jgi:hypothetical protein
MNSFFEKFSSIEQTLVQEKGPFKLFALLERATAFDDWDVIMASKGLPDNDMSVLKEVIEKIHAVLTPSPFKYINPSVFCASLSP